MSHPASKLCVKGCADEDGLCQVCDGVGECESLYSNRDAHHAHDCGHCDGSGTCSAYVDASGADKSTARARAKAEWQAFRDEQSFPITRAGFRAAWLRMFNNEPPPAALNEWVKKVSRLSKAAGCEVQL